MFETSLAQAVAQFAAVTQSVPDAALDQEWAWGAYDSEGVRFAFFRIYEDLRQLAPKIAIERITTGLAPSTAQRILAQYQAAYRDLQGALLGLKDDAINKVPAEGGWPLREVVAHIVDADAGFFGTVKYALDRYHSGDDQPAKIPDEAWEVLIGTDDASLGCFSASNRL